MKETKQKSIPTDIEKEHKTEKKENVGPKEANEKLFHFSIISFL